MSFSRRNIMTLSAAALAAAVPKLASAQAIGFTPSPIYPDPAIQILDPSFAKYRVASSSLEQVATGARWLEGPVWFGDGRYLLVSDIPNNRVMRYDEANESWSIYNANSNYANGHARDRQGRLLSCEHLTRRVTRTEYDGSITVLADNYRGKKLNSPNDIVCKSDGSIWFTDPPFGIAGEWEGEKATAELPHSVYRISPDGKLDLVTDEAQRPERPCVFRRRKEALHRRRSCIAIPYHLELRRRRGRREAFQQDGFGDGRRQWRPRRFQGRCRWQSLVRLGIERRRRR